jgi:hypothetical protein
MGRCGGLIYYAAPPPILRLQALVLHGLRVRRGNYLTEMNYHYLAEKSSRHSWADGEVQIFADDRDRVAAAVEARREVLSQPNEPVLSEVVQEAISRHRDRIMVRKMRCRKRSHSQ